jgi:hypothetical protein
MKGKQIEISLHELYSLLLLNDLHNSRVDDDW